MQGDFDLVFTGRLRSGYSVDRVQDPFAKRFNVGPDTARAMLEAEKEIVIKRNLASVDAYKLKESLELMGLDIQLKALHANVAVDEVNLELVDDAPSGDPSGARSEAAVARHLHRTGIDCPKCGLHQPHARECKGCGLIFEKYYQQAAVTNSGRTPSVPNVKVEAAREAARKSVAARKNSRRINIISGAALVLLAAGLGYAWYLGKF